MPFTDYFQEKIGNFLFVPVEEEEEQFTPPDTYYVGLFTTAPTKSSPGVEVTENDYARVAASFEEYFDGGNANGEVIEFARATSEWGEIVAIGLFDAITDGNLCAFTEVAEDDIQTVYEDSIVRIRVGKLNILWGDEGEA